jgi:4'-phosphopantetheinyl transferase
MQVTGKATGMLAPGSVHVWTIRVADGVEPCEWDLAVLDRIERDRALTFWPGPLRNKYVAIHAAVRRILAQYLSSSPDEVRIARSPLGKPFLEDSPLAFNIAHSGSFALCAVAASGETGVDIERRRHVEDVDRIVQKFFSAAEAAEYRRYDRSARLDVFFRLWTRKESLLKATGKGLRGQLDAVDVTAAICSGASVELRRAAGLAGTWALRSFTPSPGYVGALAYSGEVVSLDFFDWMLPFESRAASIPMTVASARM